MRFLITLLFACSVVTAFSQQDAVQWNAELQRTGDGLYNVRITGDLKKAWYIYATELKAEGLDVSQLIFNEQQVRTNGSLQTTGESVDIFDSIFSVQTKVFRNHFLLTQSIQLRDSLSNYITVTIKANAANGAEFLPIEETLQVRLREQFTSNNSYLLQGIDVSKPVDDCGDNGRQSTGLLQLFLLGFIGGLIALLTPCVFPMIPVTVSFFTNRSSTKQEAVKNGLLYGLFIFFIYVGASVPFHLIGNISPEIFNTISTNAWVNVFFFVVFIVFALSFFGLFEMRMPSALTNMAGSKGNLSSKSGIFFLSLTLATVSFSCTGPILGSLLVGTLSSESGAWQLSCGMAGFGAALALPFALFAMFPQWMKLLPKSGGWMDSIKIVLAFIELALAIKFLSNADLVEHWGLLKREVFIGLWIGVSICLAIYLIRTGWLLQRRNMNAAIAWTVTGVMCLFFTGYLIPGLSNTSSARLAMLSGFPPPLTYSVYGKHHAALQNGVEADVVNDYKKALALSRETGKPLLIDFTGWACVNCRKMEELVWTDPSVMQYMKEHFILVSLYVDDRKPLPVHERMLMQLADGTEKEIRTVGEQWSLFQAKNFKQVTQPLYVILSPDEQLLNYPKGYTADVREYREWLQCGMEASRKAVVVNGER